MPDTARNNIDIWLVENQEITDDALYDRFHQLLSEEEQQRCQRLVFSRHRRQFLAARALMRSVLAQTLHIDDPASLEFGSNSHGKPELLLETTLQFNLSHTNGLIVLAVMQEDAIGIDVEYLSRQADIMKLAERYFSRDETAAMKNLPVAKWNNRFFDLWTLKEAYLKACGTGLRTPLHAFSFNLDDEQVSISFAAELIDDPASWQFWQLGWADAWRMALAVNSSRADYRIRLRKGIPLQEFSEVEPQFLRASIR